MRLVQKKHTDLPFIQDIDPQGPAAKTDITVGDILLEVNGVDARASACTRDSNELAGLSVHPASGCGEGSGAGGGHSSARLTRIVPCVRLQATTSSSERSAQRMRPYSSCVAWPRKQRTTCPH